MRALPQLPFERAVLHIISVGICKVHGDRSLYSSGSNLKVKSTVQGFASGGRQSLAVISTSHRTLAG